MLLLTLLTTKHEPPSKTSAIQEIRLMDGGVGRGDSGSSRTVGVARYSEWSVIVPGWHTTLEQSQEQ